jgi:PAS domain S-box-containing protein
MRVPQGLWGLGNDFWGLGMSLGKGFHNDYVFAALATVAVWVCLEALRPVLGDTSPKSLYLVAILASAWNGGLGPGLAATALGSAAGFYQEAAEASTADTAGLALPVRIALLSGTGALLSLVIGRLRRAERRAMASALQRQQFVDKLLRSSLNGLYIYDLKAGHANYVNARFTQLTGYGPNDFLSFRGQALAGLIHPDDRAALAAHFQELRELADDESREIEYRLRTYDNRWIWCFSRHAVYARDGDGSVREVLGTFLDITDRKLPELALAYERSLLDAVQMAAPVGLGFIDRDFRFIRLNGTLAAINGLPPAEHIGRAVAEVIPELWPEVEPFFRQVLQTGEPLLNAEVSGSTASAPGVIRYWLTSHYPVHLDREIAGIGIVVVEITERKRAEQDRELLLDRERQAREEAQQAATDLAEAHALLDTLFDTAPVGIWICDRKLRYVRVNEHLNEINGLLPETSSGRTPQELLPGIADLSQILERFQAILDTGEPWLDVETSGETAAMPGVIRHWNMNFFPVRVGPEIVAIGAVVTEITERKRAEAEIRKLNEDLARRVAELETLFELAPIGLMIAEDPQCRHMRMNRTLARMLDLSPDINVSLSAPAAERPPWRVFRNGREVPPWDLPIQRAAAEGRTVAESGLEWLLDDGRRFNIVTYAAPLQDDHGKVWGAMGAFLDLTERLKLEEELKRQTAHLRALNRRKDEFLATLAHELRNPLAPIRNAAHVLRRLGSQDRTVQWAQEMIERQVQHLTHLVDDLLDVSRITRGKITLEKKPVEIAGIIERAAEATAPAMDFHRHSLVVTAPPAGVRVLGDEVRLVQIVTNLLDNAAKYSRDGKRIWLWTDIQDGEVAIRVRDEGLGIAPDLLPVIFDLFTQGDRSLARAEGGLGIGLSLVKSLVEMHDGRIEAFSEGEDRGSEFVVWLPRVDLPREAAMEETSAAGP